MASTTNPSRKPCERIFRTPARSTLKLTTLRKLLGYGKSGEEREKTFKRAITEQFKTFVSSVDDLPAFKLTKWKDRDHQRGLLEVTDDFLEVKGKGDEFWPHWNSGLRIRRLMTQMFWRMARESKRRIRSGSSNVQLSRTIRDALQQPVKTEDSSSVIDFLDWPSRFGDKGKTADDPIDLEDMPSSPIIPGLSTDNDPWANHDISFRRVNGGSENHVTDAFIPIISDIPDVTDDHDSTSTNTPLPPGSDIEPAVDPYDGPNSPPRVAQNRQDSSKRPAEPNSNNSDRPPKIPKANPSKGKQVARSTTITMFGRYVKQREFPDRSTDEQLDAAVGSESSFAPQEGSYAGRCRRGQAKDSTYGSALATPVHRGASSSKTPQPTSRAQAVHLATEEAERVAGQVQAAAMGQASSSAVAQQQRPCVVPDTISLPQAGSSESQEQARISGTNHIASAARKDAEIGEVPLEAPRNQLRPNQSQRMALETCRITYRSSISYNGTIHSVLTFEPSIFQMSLDDVLRVLDLNDSFATFYIVFHTLEEGAYPYRVRDQDDFETFRVECLSMITSSYRLSQLIPKAQRQPLHYRVLFSRTSNAA
ncbi:hypothetical protein NW768_006629 [Fusarium equiseti]|uniref:Uncharacterized protein n=1 Tax=Fusarium equiseti TaxID=61235 RepID=A0ABQ8RC27_FUSEQ|nr:hypothetical protein NW768_006629 [Fusarium equiseti]